MSSDTCHPGMIQRWKSRTVPPGKVSSDTKDTLPSWDVFGMVLADISKSTAPLAYTVLDSTCTSRSSYIMYAGIGMCMLDLTCTSHGSHMTHAHHMAVTCTSHGSHMTHAHHMAVTCTSHGSHMTHHMAVT